MRIEHFPLIWRWTQSSHTVLPADVLSLLTPIESDAAELLYLRGEDAFSGRAIANAFEHRSENSDVTREWLRCLPVPSEERVLLLWSRQMGIALPWQVFVRYWEDFCYPSSDDAFIFVESTGSCVAWYHYEVFRFREGAV